jgi:hypothetical protein
MNKPLQKQQPAQIQLELPDYSYAYEQWKRKQESLKREEDSNVIIIDIY